MQPPPAPPPATGKPFPEVLANLHAQGDNLTDLFFIILELLENCRLRHQLGPVEGLTPAPTVIQNTLWIPWIGGSGTYMLADLFRPDGSGNVSGGD
jgi:hypothetical protein